MNHFKVILLIGLLFFYSELFSQDISGSWRWFEIEEAAFEFNLKKALDKFPELDYVGTHCGVAHSGERIDCSLDEYSIFLKKRSPNIYEGTVTSAYSLTDFEIQLTYLEKTDEILWEVIKEGDGLFYFPLKKMMKR